MVWCGMVCRCVAWLRVVWCGVWGGAAWAGVGCGVVLLYFWVGRFSTGWGGVNRAPKNGGGGWEKASIDATIHQ